MGNTTRLRDLLLNEFLNQTFSNISEVSEEEDPTEATLIYETKNIKEAAETTQQDNKTIYTESSKVEKVSQNCLLQHPYKEKIFSLFKSKFLLILFSKNCIVHDCQELMMNR